ncbi:hypothetical protein FXO37_30446 [Capsicum annuum]|nr:hypothetical protein FXO37_30446 [Capsicum annuum]
MICGHRYSTGTHWNLDSVTCGRGSGTVLAQTGRRNYILSGLQDDLYNVHSGTKIAKEFWGALEWKYKIENAGTKKFFIARFLEYKMIDNKSVSPKCRNCK